MIKSKLLFLLSLSLLLITTTSKSQQKLETIFTNPPDDAKPRGYWLWAHGNFDYSTILEELKAYKEMGLGGADIFDMGIEDPYNIIPAGNTFLGDKMVDGIAFALKEAKKLNLKMGLSVSNGWNAGGDWTTSEEKLMRLLFWKDTVKGPININEIGFPEVPTTFEKPYGTFQLYPKFNADGFPEYYKNVSLVAYPLSADNQIKNFDQIIYFDTEKINGNLVDVNLPEGNWVLLRAVVTPLGQKMWMPSDNSNGFIMDHYAKKVTKRHFEYIIDKLENKIENLGESSLERLYLASFEAEDYVIWSPELREEFLKQHGYKIDPYIPIFAGQTIIDEDVTERFLHDYRSTVSEMFVNNHYRQASKICREHGLLLASESGGPGPPLHYVPTEDLKALGAVDIMRGEFWNREIVHYDENGNDLIHVVKNIASAAHIYGHKIVEMEAFTSFLHWQEQPVELKKLADKAFCEGMTRVVYHTMTHSPKEAGVPGWSYQAGTHISPKMTWWKLSKPFHAYLARTSAMLQQGQFVADVAYYYGEKIPNFASGTKFKKKTLGKGYDYDDLNKEILLQSSVTEDGRIKLPSGMTYHLLVLPNDKKMSLEVIQKIEELLQNGATVLGNKPITVPGLDDYKTKETELKAIADKIWGKAKQKKKQKYGKGVIYTGYEEQEILAEKGIMQDFQFTASNNNNSTLDYIHRRADNKDIYFVSNEDSVAVNSILDFRVNNKQPYLFNPKSGEITKIALFENNNGRIKIPYSFEALGSIFIVFKENNIIENHAVALEINGEKEFPQLNNTNLDLYFNQQNQLVLETSKAGKYSITFSDGTTKKIIVESYETTINLENSWDIRFPHGWGFEPIQQFDKLIDWTKHNNENIAGFSGLATYHGTFTMKNSQLAKDKTYCLDLGDVGSTARVFLNGYEVGTDVFPPYHFDLKDYLREGENYITIDVANTWLNKLIQESTIPFEDKKTRSNVGSGNRQSAQRPWQDSKFQPSGLMGPVTIEARKKIILN